MQTAETAPIAYSRFTARFWPRPGGAPLTIARGPSAPPPLVFVGALKSSALVQMRWRRGAWIKVRRLA